MLDKIKSLLPQLMTKARQALSNVPAPVKWVAALYGCFVFGLWALCLGLFIAAYMGGTAKWSDLLELCREVTSPAAISFATFVIGLCIDSNGNGVPDNMEADNAKG